MKTDHERDAFRIIRSYHKKSLADTKTDFPIAVQNLGDRLGITTQGASKMRKKFETNRIIKLTQPYQPNKAAARYKWDTNAI